MLDTGKLQARDGKTYSLGKSLVIFTTNKGDDQIYPVNLKEKGRVLSCVGGEHFVIIRYEHLRHRQCPRCIMVNHQNFGSHHVQTAY